MLTTPLSLKAIHNQGELEKTMNKETERTLVIQRGMLYFS